MKELYNTQLKAEAVDCQGRRGMATGTEFSFHHCMAVGTHGTFLGQLFETLSSCKHPRRL